MGIPQWLHCGPRSDPPDVTASDPCGSSKEQVRQPGLLLQYLSCDDVVRRMSVERRDCFCNLIAQCTRHVPALWHMAISGKLTSGLTTPAHHAWQLSSGLAA